MKCKIIFGLISLLSLGGCAATAEKPLEPTDAITQYRADLARANTSYQAKNYAQAQAQFLALYQQNNSDTSVLFKLGNIYSHLQQFDKAIVAYQQLLSIKPNANKAWHNLAVAQTQQSIMTWQTLAQQLPSQDPLRKKAQYYHSKLQSIINNQTP